MQPHVERMAIELAELNAKCEALHKFMGGDVWPTLPKDKRDLMAEQYALMREYALVLSKRIDLETA